MPQGESGVSQCAMLGVEIAPDITDTDQCTIRFMCSTSTRLEVKCDGENDGTFTSLCECFIDGTHVALEGVFAGEAPDSCLAATSKCLQRLP
jgi:membrane-bound inhibitor of C-type lysozyme